MSLARSRAAYILLRPLLYAAGAAVTGALVYYHNYYVKKRGNGERTAEPDTTHTEGPVQTQLPAVDGSLLDPGWMSEVDGIGVTQTDGAGLRDYEAECQAHRALNSQYEIQETLTHTEELLKVNLAEAEEKYKQAMESKTQLENKKMDLMSDVSTLRGSMKQLEEQFAEARRRNDEIKRELAIQQGILRFEMSKAEEQVKDLKQKISSLKVSLNEAETRYAESLESITQLENENYDLVNDMYIVQETVDDLEEQLSQTQTRCNEATMEMETKSRELSALRSRLELLNQTVLKDYETERAAHGALKLQYNELMERHDQLLNVTLAEAVAKYEQAMESNAQLESEKSELQYHVHKMVGSVQKLEKILDEVEISCDMIKQDRKREQEAYNILKSQYEEALKQRDELLIERERERARERAREREKERERAGGSECPEHEVQQDD